MIAIETREGAALRGRWLRLRWSQSLDGQPARLLVRFVRRTETEHHLLAAAILGRGAWTWRAPDDLERLEILAPANSAGAMRIDRLGPVSMAELLAGLLRRSPAALPAILWPGTTPRGRNVRMHEALDLADIADFDRFAAERRRPPEPEGLDSALFAKAARGPSLGFALAVSDAAELPALSHTLAAFTSQHDGAFRLLALAPPAIADSLARANLDDRLTIAPLPSAKTADEATLAAAAAFETDYVARLCPGDEPVPEAVLSLRAFLAEHPALDCLYADGSLRTRTGSSAQLKPDWSPAFQESLDYIGRPCLVRPPLAALAASWRDLPGAVSAEAGAGAIGHLKRVLVRLAPGEPAEARSTAATEAAVPGATLVVPTRDRVELLRRLCENLFSLTPNGPHGRWDLVIVDNGSEDEAALAYLAELETRPDTRVLRRPGPFNFSALVNAGVESARGEVIVLLNNDCEIVRGDWLERLAGWAGRPGIGAVGARLLYADGALQHAGVALGLGGEAGHRDRAMPGDHPGHLVRLTTPHEVAAVTAACLAVRTETFRAAGGFDERLPVAFNDIDFCLRLLGRGLRNILEPGAVLVHAESASRGPERGERRARFLAEAALFRERWRNLVLDDPYSHPALTTFRFRDRLG